MKEPVRILNVVTHMNRGGLETMIMNYYRNIDREKIQFDFLTHRHDKKDYDDEIKELGGRIYHLPELNPLRKSYLNNLDEFFKLHKEYNIVHAHLDTLSTYPLKYAKKYAIPIRIAHSHTTRLDLDFKYPIKHYSKLRIPKFATQLFACGVDAGKWMYGNNEFKILNNAIEAEKYMFSVDKSIKIKNNLNLHDKYVIGHIGRFNKMKNHNFIIDIFKDIVDKNDNCILMLIGTGELVDEVSSKIKKLNLQDKVLFLGLRSDIAELLQAIDIFLFPSVFEGFPVSLLEAQASGVKCIVSDSITKSVNITNEVEFISLNQPSKYWADRILSYMSGYTRKNTYVEICKSGYDIRENARWLEGYYLNLLSKTNLRF